MSDLTPDEIRELRAIHRAKGSNGLTMRLLDQLSRAQPLLELAEELAKLPGPEHYAGPDDIPCAECGDVVGDGSPAHCDLCYRAFSVRLSDLEEEVRVDNFRKLQAVIVAARAYLDASGGNDWLSPEEATAWGELYDRLRELEPEEKNDV